MAKASAKALAEVTAKVTAKASAEVTAEVTAEATAEALVGGPAQVFPPIIFFSGGRPNFSMHQNPPKNRQTPNKERPIF